MVGWPTWWIGSPRTMSRLPWMRRTRWATAERPPAPHSPKRCTAATSGCGATPAYGFAPLGAAAVPALGGMLADGDPEVRARAVDTLGDVGPPAAGSEAELIAALGDESELVRGHAADALGTVYADTADAAPAAAALAAVVEDQNEVVRRNAALSLARVGPAAGAAADQVAAALAAGLGDASHYVRGYSVLGLRRLGTPRARGELIAYLESTRWDPSQHQD